MSHHQNRQQQQSPAYVDIQATPQGVHTSVRAGENLHAAASTARQETEWALEQIEENPFSENEKGDPHGAIASIAHTPQGLHLNVSGRPSDNLEDVVSAVHQEYKWASDQTDCIAEVYDVINVRPPRD